MFASHYVSDAAVFPQRPPRGPFGLEPGFDRQPARKRGLLDAIRGLRPHLARGR